MRLIFMGSPEFSATVLAALLDTGHEIACVYSQPPRPAGRGRTLRKTAVHDLADARKLPVRTPASLKKVPEQEAFAALRADLAVVVAYGLILPQPVLDAPRLGCVNLHASLLPRWRGAAPIQRAIMAGDSVTGVQAMIMEAGLDTGPVLEAAETPIRADDTAGTLHDRLALLGAGMLPGVIGELEAGKITAQPQAETGITYAHKITPADQVIDWTRPARDVDCQIRGLAPHPGAHCGWQSEPASGETRLKCLMSCVEEGEGIPGTVLDNRLLVACGTGAVRLHRVQRPGRGPMSAEDFLRGTPVPAGTRFS